MPIVEQQLDKAPSKPLNKIRGPAWSMMKQQRMTSVQNPYKNLSPGHYYKDKSGKTDKKTRVKSIEEHNPSSYFRSESVRSFFDHICFQTNQQKKAMLREAGGYKSTSLGPGSYEPGQRHVAQSKFQFFGSTEERRLV